jgi:signal transduction histidine kinase
LLLFTAALPQAAHAIKNVLLLFDENDDLPGLATINRSVREIIASELNGDVEFYSESLNLSQFPGADHEALMLDYLRRKYAGKRVDVVVAVLSPSLDFLLRNRGTLFQTVPIVFCGVDGFELTREMVGPGVTGVLLRRTYAPSVDIALSLNPRTRNVYVVGGTSVFDMKVQAIARRDLARLESRVRITYLTTLAMNDLLKTVSTLPPDSAVLYLTIFADGAGRAFIPHNALSIIANASNAPTYVAVDQYVGLGAVGGHVYSTAKHARSAADIAVRVLNGEPTARIPITEAVDHTNLFDWRQLVRWRIDEKRLPPGSVIAFRPPSVWGLYKWYIVAGVSLLFLQTGLIVGLLANRAQRRRAENVAQDSESRRQSVEEELRQQRRELAHALRVTTLGELTTSFAHEMGQPLMAILANAQAVRRLRKVNNSDPDIDDALSDIAEAARHAGNTIERLRSLVKKERGERTLIEVNTVIEEVLRLLRTDLMQKGIEAELTPGDNLPAVYADPTELRQVILNLIVNAEDAIASAGDRRGRIQVQTRAVDPGAVAISVSDNGVGLDEPELQRMFDHFVTSKPGGLGMGLAISRSIIAAHGGHIWASRNEDCGLTLHVELPASQCLRSV